MQIPKIADQWMVLRTQGVEQLDLEANQGNPESSNELTAELARLKTELADLDASMIDSSMLPNVQAELIELLRESGCQIRKVAIQSSSTETWEPEKKRAEVAVETNIDDPAAAPQPRPLGEDASPYTLNTERINLSLSGNLSQVIVFYEKLRQKKWMLRVAQMSFAQTPDENGGLSVETTVAFLKLTNSNAPVEQVNWREGSRANQTN